jgi:hypothetical protein
MATPMATWHVADQDLNNNACINDDMWDAKITLQCVTFYHGSKRVLVKKLSQKHQLGVGQKNCPSHNGLVKSTCPRKLRGFFLSLTL